jgi:hypothetical protein
MGFEQSFGGRQAQPGVGVRVFDGPNEYLCNLYIYIYIYVYLIR